jgi:hypothetical protein
MRIGLAPERECYCVAYLVAMQFKCRFRINCPGSAPLGHFDVLV